MRAEAASSDFYSALDCAINKLDSRLRRAADRRRIHRGRHAPRGTHRAKDFEREQAAANLPLIRMFREESGPAGAPQREGKGHWVLCSVPCHLICHSHR